MRVVANWASQAIANGDAVPSVSFNTSPLLFSTTFTQLVFLPAKRWQNHTSKSSRLRSSAGLPPAPLRCRAAALGATASWCRGSGGTRERCRGRWQRLWGWGPRALPGLVRGRLGLRSGAVQGTSSAVRRERRRWRLIKRGAEAVAEGAEELPRSAPAGVEAAARALAGLNATVERGGDAGGGSQNWYARAPSGLEWKLQPVGATVELEADKQKFRTSEFFEVEGVVSPGGLPSSSALRVLTVYRKVRAEDSPTGGRFKIGLGTIDKTKPFIVQAIQTASIVPPPPGPGRKSPDLPLVTYKTRLLFSPILPDAE
mmetsp:Transcript_12185/g.24808  ORF Transcript_12185/g.24808 Transcript_12185/m.24808 type:complete len:314 (-) Transcript_12185:29-970(-)